MIHRIGESYHMIHRIDGMMSSCLQPSRGQDHSSFCTSYEDGSCPEHMEHTQATNHISKRVSSDKNLMLSINSARGHWLYHSFISGYCHRSLHCLCRIANMYVPCSVFLCLSLSSSLVLLGVPSWLLSVAPTRSSLGLSILFENNFGNNRYQLE